jgi:hypothetical protein
VDGRRIKYSIDGTATLMEHSPAAAVSPGPIEAHCDLFRFRFEAVFAAFQFLKYFPSQNILG